MHSAAQAAPVSKKMLWAGRILSGLTVLFLLFDSIIHVMKIAPVVEAFAQLGYPPSLAVGLGILELVCLVVCVLPRTSVLGAILLTLYPGGAIATALFPVYVGVVVWAGVFLRDNPLSALIPVRR